MNVDTSPDSDALDFERWGGHGPARRRPPTPSADFAVALWELRRHLDARRWPWWHGGMCGRFALAVPWKTVVALLEATPLDDDAWEPAYNICPTDRAPVVCAGDGGDRHLRRLRWGLVPWWAKDARVGARMINARSETAAKKRSFARAFRARRCLVPASGFYEWTADPETRAKQPHWIHAPEGRLLTFAGLWARWRDPERDAALDTFTILTTAANDDVRPVHDRMPAIVDGEDRARWLAPDAPVDALERLLAPYGGRLDHYRVDKRVNQVRSEGPELIAPIDGAPENLELDL